jgi:hypothetical protein
MTDFVGVGSLSKVALFFLSGIKKINWSGITHSDSQETGFFTECAGPNASSRKKNRFLGPMRKSYLFNECLNPTYFRRDFSLRQGYFYQLSGLGHLLNQESFAGMTRKCQN